MPHLARPLTAAVTALTAPCLADVSIFGNLPGPPAELNPTYYSAPYLTGPDERHLSDAFEITQPASISTIRFWGRDFTPSSPIGGYFICIWNGDAVSSNGIPDSPGSVHFSELVPASSPRLTHTPWPDIEPLNFPDTYEISLPTPIELAANTRYYFTVAGQGDFTWAVGSSGFGIESVYNINSFDSWYTFAPPFGPLYGRAFELRGVPTPGSAVVLLAAAGCTLTRRRRPPRRCAPASAIA